MRPGLRQILPLLTTLVFVVGCNDDETTEPETTFDLTLQGDATFQTPHGGQDITVALLGADGTVLETMSGTVSATDDPAFSFTFADALTEGESYTVDYWIDSNFGGGTVGTCDPSENDHQWSLAVPPVAADVMLAEDHDPSAVTDVCSVF